MKRKIPIILIFIVGICIMLYPFFSNWWNQREQEVIIVDYSSAIEALKQEEIDAEFEASKKYNESLLGNVVLTDPFDPEAEKISTEEYNARLNISGDGVMGYIEIPGIDVRLSIFHGTSSEVLVKAAGHLENTSLPIGGIGTHAVISAHTGYSNAKFFDNLIDLEEGDMFYITVLNEKMAYQIDQIKVVKPTETSDLAIDRNEDYVTLVTCTPYGINSHRLLVRGTRVPYVEDAMQPETKANHIIAIVLLIILVIIIAVLIVRKIKRGRRHEK